MMKLNSKQVESVIALPGPQRYQHFIKQVVDSEEVFGLYKNGWALAATTDGREVFPLWPAEEYAALCAKDEWEGFEPACFSLSDLVDELLPKLQISNVLPGIFYTPQDKGVTPEVDQLIGDLKVELAKY